MRIRALSAKITTMGSRAYGAALALLLAAGCSGDPGPAAVMEAWLGHLARGEVQQAFALLSSRSRDLLSEAEDAWISGRPHPLAPSDGLEVEPESPRGLSLFRRLVAGPGFHGAPPVPEDAGARVQAEVIDGDRAVVTVKTLNGSSDAHLIREDGVWRVAVLP